MGITKSDLFTKEQNHLANLAKVLGHPARIAILEHLLKQKACINGDLVEELGLAQPTISQHLRELKENNIIKGSIDGTKVSYCINAETWEEMRELFAAFFAQYHLDGNYTCC